MRKTNLELYQSAQLRTTKVAEVNYVIKRLLAGQQRYEGVAKTLGNGIPWWFIGITHFMEAGGFKNPFAYHLHCGDPLTGRTTHVPKGRPVANPGGGKLAPSKENPYSWEESAIDALTLMSYHDDTNWSLGDILDKFEAFNGLGYKRKGLPSPYLWSYTMHYEKGKYVADGKYDPNAISKQPGVAAIMLALGIK